MRKEVTIRKKVEGQVRYNNGDFVEVLTYGLDGIDTGIFLDQIQISRWDTNNNPKEFERTFPIGRSRS